MIKTLIVEDDIFDYSHLKNLLPWDEEGFLLCDGARSGAEAINIIQHKELDLIITDMSMPGADGIELIKYVRKNFPSVKILAISGYDDFFYVKHSLKMGAVDYILKHNLTPDSLLQILNTVKKAISEEQQLNLQQEKLERRLRTGRHVLIRDFINRLVKEGLTEQRVIKEELDLLGIKLHLQNLVVVAAELDDYSYLKEKYSESEINDLQRSFSNMVEEILKDMANGVMTFLAEARFVIIFSFINQNSEQAIYNQVTTTVNRIRSTIKQNFNLTASFAISDICSNVTEIKRYYQRAEQMLNKRFYHGRNKTFFDTSGNEIKKNTVFLGIQEEKKLINSLKKMDKELMNSLIGRIFDNISQMQPSIDSVKITTIAFLNIVSKLAKEYGVETADIYDGEDNPYEQLSKYDTVQKLREWILSIYNNFFVSLQSSSAAQLYGDVTGRAIQYINENYKEEISLGIVAEKIGVNSSYLSRRFKKDSGRGFIEYLNHIRVEKAKALLAGTNCQVKEIAPEVGFNNYNYFFKVFKDSQGMTPVEYEKSIRPDLK